MDFSVEAWSPDYGSPVELGAEPDEATASAVNLTVECSEEAWAPITPHGQAAETVVFVDGVQRIDARLWVHQGSQPPGPGLCVSYAAGAVVSNGRAGFSQLETRHFVVGTAVDENIDCGLGVTYEGAHINDGTPEGLNKWLNDQREDLEVRVAGECGGDHLIVIDGHIRKRESMTNAVGYIKSHQFQYLPPAQAEVVGRLEPGQRTPVFEIPAWRRYSWYLRLPGPRGHPWAGIVRCEASPSLELDEVISMANYASITLPRFASQPYKDTRAPQNLYPVAGLERELRRRMGDQALLLRALQRASHF